MSTTRLHSHPSLPAPVVHAGFSVPQSKSHVLAGVQDAYWSDDETEDAECPLCLEEMDISDLNFKPCICGYQICRFCWHHIKENLNKRCPACRRIYTDDAVEFKPIATQDHKRLTQQKKQRERERKELDALGRRHLANVRVVQRNMVYVVGIGPRFAKEELIPTLRSNEYFGQYGKITKILLVKRTPSGGGAPVVGLYITYHRREDAARALAGVDGSPSPSGGRDLMRASYGTTKYCMAFLRGVPCSDHSCMNLHEWGDEKDCFTKEDLTTLKHTMKATESRSRTTTTKKTEEDGLPRAASWAQKGVTTQTSSPSASIHASSVPPVSRQTRRGGTPRQGRAATNLAQTVSTEARNTQAKSAAEKKPVSAQASSRPATPAGEVSSQSTAPPLEVPPTKGKKEVPSELLSPSPVPSNVAESEVDSATHESAVQSPKISARIDSASQSPIIYAPPSMTAPAVPPGLSAPPGIPSPSRPPRVATSSPQTPLLASQTSYQMSNAARALLDDVKARRTSTIALTGAFSPFPDLDRTLQTLSESDGGFSFSLDPKLAVESSNEQLPDFDAEVTSPFRGSYVDAFPALHSSSSFMSPPGLPYPHNPNRSIYDPLSVRSPVAPAEKLSSASYAGSFNPFAESPDEMISLGSPTRQMPNSPLNEDRKVSRFGFARGRQGSTANSSPLHASSPLSNNIGDSHAVFNPNDGFPQHTPPPPGLWGHQGRQEYGFTPLSSNMGSPLVQHAQAQPLHQQPQFSPFEKDVSEAQLRDFIQASRERTNGSLPEHHMGFNSSQPFHDPAIMSAGFAASIQEQAFNTTGYGPPPGLSFPQNMDNSRLAGGIPQVDDMRDINVSTSPSPAPSISLSALDFPALTSATGNSSPVQKQSSAETQKDAKAREKAERKAAKLAVAAERAAEKAQLAQERTALKAAEKAKLLKEKEEKAAVEREEAIKLKVQAAVDAKEQERAAAARAAMEKSAQLVREKALQSAKEKAPQIAKDNNRPNASSVKSNDLQKPSKVMPVIKDRPTKPSPVPSPSETTSQVPLLSKKPKKNKPVTKPLRIAKEEDSIRDDGSNLPSATTSDAPGVPSRPRSACSISQPESVDHHSPTSVASLLEEINLSNPQLHLETHPFFDLNKLSSSSKMPLEHASLVQALSALSTCGSASGASVESAISSFQQLLEILTQTMSDLLWLLPRDMWDDGSSFDAIMRDMLKCEDLHDEAGELKLEDDEDTTLAMVREHRAKWMENQLSTLEELHRDINTAAVRAVLSFNDTGRGHRHEFLPCMGNTLERFDKIAGYRTMTAEELEKKLVVAEEAAVFAETEVREGMEYLQSITRFQNSL